MSMRKTTDWAIRGQQKSGLASLALRSEPERKEAETCGAYSSDLPALPEIIVGDCPLTSAREKGTFCFLGCWDIGIFEKPECPLFPGYAEG